MDESWTLSELVAEVATRIARLPDQSNGQVRAVPDERTIRYYGTLGLLARPIAMRGRTALYGRRHLAQVIAIKRMQTAGRSLADIQALWTTLDDATLQRMSGVNVPVAQAGVAPPARPEFWKRTPVPAPSAPPATPSHAPPPPAAELRIELAPGAHLTIAMSDDIAVSTADVRAIRAAAALLVTELAARRLIQEEGP